MMMQRKEGWSRRRFMKTLGAASVGAAVGRVGFAQTRRKPNVLIIFPDQWRRQALSCNGDPVVKTPNLDRLAREGMNFTRCYTTNPVCSPARAAFQTGRYPHQTGMIHNNLYLRSEEICLAECFKEAGYATGYIGKWHLDGPERPGFVKPDRRQGYDYFEGFNRGHWYHNAQYFTNDGELKRPNVFESFYQTDLAIEFMKRHAREPFLLFLSYGPPHMPYNPPEDFRRVKPEDLKWRPNVPENMRRDERTIRELCGYYGLCETLDHEVGRLMGFLEKSGLAEDTIVFFTSDHGDCHGSHGLHYKGHPEEESLGIPLIVRFPGMIPAGKVSDALISTIDFAPTLLGLCGIKIPARMAGTDMSPVLKGGDAPERALYCEGRMSSLGQRPRAGKRRKKRIGSAYGAWRALVTKRYKIAVDFTGKVRLLTDLSKDPYELKNLADDPAHESLRKELLARLKEEGKKTGDPFPEPVPSAPEA